MQVGFFTVSLISLDLQLYCRLQLASLHFNENGQRDHATTKTGERRYDVVFPKYKKGGCVARKVRVPPTYSELTISLVNYY